MRVALIGAGAMGAPMGRRLVSAGHDLRVWNRTRERAEAIEREMTGKKRPFVTLSPKPTRRRGLPKKRPTVIEKALGKHGSKGKKRAARKG